MDARLGAKARADGARRGRMARMKTRALAFLTLGFLTTSMAAHSATPRLVYDVSHGQTSVIRQMPELGLKLGFDVVSVATPLTAEALRDARLLYLRTPLKLYSDDEKRAIVEFVRGGGSLLVVLDESLRVDLAASGVNDVISPFGLTLTADTEYIHNGGAIAKAGVINRADRELPFSGGRAVDGGTPFAWQLDREGKPAQPFASSATVGKARIVVMSEAMASAFMGKAEGVRLTGVPRDPANTVFWGKDSMVFMEEVLAWLIAR
jgi:hypothetical protein